MHIATHDGAGACSRFVSVGALYALCALVATALNLAMQELTLVFTSSLSASILVGTASGFLGKYLMDKMWIFGDSSDSAPEEMKKVFLYGTFSVATTVLFWVSEVAFWMIWQSDVAKYTGAVIGLAIGYAVKFGLDSRFVFRKGGA